MGLADGDLYVSGSILSFQQMKRIYQNFRAATVPSNLQAGALWSDSDDDRLWHQGTSLYEVFTEMTTLTFENLLSNSGFGVWSQSGAGKGLATMGYDAGAKGAGAAPSVGDAAVGGTSGATAKVISYTITSGAFATNDAAGVFTLGAVTGTFINNETVTFGGVETVLVKNDKSIGIVNDPMDGDDTGDWTLVDCTLAFDTNHYEITRTAASQVIYQVVSLTIGKIYKIECDIKDGTEAGVDVKGYYYNGSAGVNPGPIFETAAGWASASWTFEATATSASSRVGVTSYLAGAANIEVRNLSCYEITPCCTAAATAAFDGWNKDSTADIYREHSNEETTTKRGSFYALKFVPTTAGDFVRISINTPKEVAKYRGRTITIGAWMLTNAASHARIRAHDGDYTNSSYHTGGGAWEWIEMSITIDTAATAIQIYPCRTDLVGEVDGSTIVYVSQPMVVFGSHIGEGNYQPKPQEIIWLESFIDSNELYEILSQSDIAYAAINLEADTDGILPKDAKAVQVVTRISDSGSAADANCGLILRADITIGYFFRNSISGQPNDADKYQHGWQGLTLAGDYEYQINASGASTFDLDRFRYMAVQVN